MFVLAPGLTVLADHTGAHFTARQHGQKENRKIQNTFHIVHDTYIRALSVEKRVKRHHHRYAHHDHGAAGGGVFQYAQHVQDDGGGDDDDDEHGDVRGDLEIQQHSEQCGTNIQLCTP